MRWHGAALGQCHSLDRSEISTNFRLFHIRYRWCAQLQTANMTLTERGGHVNLAQREIEQNKSQLERVKEKLARERVRTG